MSSSSSIDTDFGVISDDPKVVERCKNLCEGYGFSVKDFPSLDVFLEKGAEGGATYRVLLASLKSLSSKEAAAELAQGVRYVSQDSFMIVAVSGSLERDAAQFAKKSGANLILLQEEIANTSKLEFSVLQVLKASFLPIKVADLMPNVEIPLNIYHLLPQRRKFMPILREGELLSAAKYEKCKEVGELYIQRVDAEKFNQFVAAHPDNSAAGLARRCRSQYLALYSSFASLVFLLTDQSEYASFAAGKTLMDKCKQLCGSLLATLAEFGDAWDVINNSSIGELGSAERSPAVAALAGLFGLTAGMNDVDQVMLGALLADIGLVLLPPHILAAVREGTQDSLHAEDRAIYENYPNMTLDILLNRKIGMDDKLRLLLVSTHERADGKGFPKQPNSNKIPLAAQLIQYSRDFDRRTMLKMGQARPDRTQVRTQMSAEDATSFQRYTGEFWRMMKSVPIK